MSEATAFRNLTAAGPDAKAIQCFSSALRFARGLDLPELADEVCRAEVGVAFERLYRFVATDSPYLYRVKTSLKKTGHRLMSKVMEP